MSDQVGRAEPRVGESHDVEVERLEVVGADTLVVFRDLVRRHRRYVEVFSASEFESIGDADRGTITRTPTRSRRAGRWSFTRAGVSDV